MQETRSRPAGRAALALVGLVLLGGCASSPPQGDPPTHLTAFVPTPDSEYQANRDPDLPPLYRVWYGTNRLPIDSKNHAAGFTGMRDASLPSDRLHYGRCYVQIPESHDFGTTGSSWLMRIIKRSDDRLKLESIEEIPDSSFFEQMRGKLSQRAPGDQNVLVYIHGYNSSFDEAAIRAAQIGFDLKVQGITAFFSWPSRGATTAYAVDEATVDVSEPYLQTFLTRLLQESGAEQINVIAHSMGNRAFLRVLDKVQSTPPFAVASGRPPFHQIILAAPDVDSQLFGNLAAVYPRLSKRTTLYVSSKDQALRSSGIVHDFPRAGFAPPITVVNDLDTIEVSKIDLTVLGHSYFGNAEEVLHDMYDLLQLGVEPDRRPRIREAKNALGRRYWVFK